MLSASATVGPTNEVPASTIGPHVLFTHRRAIDRYERAPLKQERDSYLANLKAQGTSHGRAKCVASTLLNIIRILQLDVVRVITPREVLQAGEYWEKESPRLASRGSVNHGKLIFLSTARRFLRFHRLLREEPDPLPSFEEEFRSYLDHLKLVQGLALSTTDVYRRRVRDFLLWLSQRRPLLSLLVVQDVDDYLTLKRKTSGRRTIVAYYHALRSFLAYAELRGWCDAKVRYGTQPPTMPRCEAAAVGPCWDDVRMLIASADGGRASDHRARAILVFCAVYGMRSSEVSSLRLEDFDWRNATFRLSRSKSRRTQQFPIQKELGEAIVSYLKNARPLCACRNLFVTLSPPYRKVSAGVLSGIVAKKMVEHRILCGRYGAHALRHACATQLLRSGSSLSEIADFLGHKNINTVSVYAKHDKVSLVEIANFGLGEVL